MKIPQFIVTGRKKTRESFLSCISFGSFSEQEMKSDVEEIESSGEYHNSFEFGPSIRQGVNNETQCQTFISINQAKNKYSFNTLNIPPKLPQRKESMGQSSKGQSSMGQPSVGRGSAFVPAGVPLERPQHKSSMKQTNASITAQKKAINKMVPPKQPRRCQSGDHSAFFVA